MKFYVYNILRVRIAISAAYTKLLYSTFLRLTGYLVQSSFCDNDLFPEGFQLDYRWRAITHVGTVFPSEHLTKYSLNAYVSVQTYQNVTTFQVRVIVVTTALTSVGGLVLGKRNSPWSS